jgi:hypothetical protein
MQRVHPGEAMTSAPGAFLDEAIRCSSLIVARRQDLSQDFREIGGRMLDGMAQQAHAPQKIGVMSSRYGFVSRSTGTLVKRSSPNFLTYFCMNRL